MGNVVLQCGAMLPKPYRTILYEYCFTLIVVMHSLPHTCHSVSLAIYKSNLCNLWSEFPYWLWAPLLNCCRQRKPRYSLKSGWIVDKTLPTPNPTHWFHANLKLGGTGPRSKMLGKLKSYSFSLMLRLGSCRVSLVEGVSWGVWEVRQTPHVHMVYVCLLTVPPIALGAWSMVLGKLKSYSFSLMFLCAIQCQA